VNPVGLFFYGHANEKAILVPVLRSAFLFAICGNLIANSRPPCKN
jgi:hypothetical protein